MKFFLRFYTFTFLSLSLAVTSFAQEMKKVMFAPQWSAQAQFAGYYAALEQGFYADEGLDVDIIHPNQALNAMTMLHSGKCDFVTSDLLSGVIQKDMGFDIVNIYQSSQNSGLVLVSHIPLENGLATLQNKRIGRWKAGFSLLAITALSNSNTDVQWIDFMSGVNLFLSGAVDATLSMSYNEYLTILETGTKLSDKQVLRFSELNLNLPEEGLYTTREMIESDPEMVHKFASASAKGWAWVHENTDEALEMVMRIVKQENIPTNRTHQKGMLFEVLRLQKNAQGEIKTSLSEKDFYSAAEILLKNGAITQKPVYEDFITPKK